MGRWRRLWGTGPRRGTPRGENGGDVAFNKISDFVFGYYGGFLCRLDDGQRFSVSEELELGSWVGSSAASWA